MSLDFLSEALHLMNLNSCLQKFSPMLTSSLMIALEVAARLGSAVAMAAVEGIQDSEGT